MRILVTSHYWDGFGYGASHDSESASQISDATKTTHLPLESGGYDFWRKSLKQKLHQVWELHYNRGLPNKNRADVQNFRGKSAPTNLKKNTKNACEVDRKSKDRRKEHSATGAGCPLILCRIIVQNVTLTILAKPERFAKKKTAPNE